MKSGSNPFLEPTSTKLSRETTVCYTLYYLIGLLLFSPVCIFRSPGHVYITYEVLMDPVHVYTGWVCCGRL